MVQMPGKAEWKCYTTAHGEPFVVTMDGILMQPMLHVECLVIQQLDRLTGILINMVMEKEVVLSGYHHKLCVLEMKCLSQNAHIEDGKTIHIIVIIVGMLVWYVKVGITCMN